MNTATIFALMLCTSPGPNQLCVLDTRTPFATVEECRDMAKQYNVGYGGRASAKCVSKQTLTWEPVE